MREKGRAKINILQLRFNSRAEGKAGPLLPHANFHHPGGCPDDPCLPRPCQVPPSDLHPPKPRSTTPSGLSISSLPPSHAGCCTEGGVGAKEPKEKRGEGSCRGTLGSTHLYLLGVRKQQRATGNGAGAEREKWEFQHEAQPSDHGVPGLPFFHPRP